MIPRRCIHYNDSLHLFHNIRKFSQFAPLYKRSHLEENEVASTPSKNKHSQFKNKLKYDLSSSKKKSVITTENVEKVSKFIEYQKQMGSTAQEEPKRSKSSSNDEQKSPDVVLQRLDNLMDAKSPKPSRRNRKHGIKRPEHESNLTKYHTTSEKILENEIKQSIPPNKNDIPKLAHNLDRVLFSPGVHFLQDPRTRIYNFSPFLKKVISYKDFNFDAIEGFTPASKHADLLMNAQKFKKQFYSSTSAMTPILSKFYALLNDYKPLNVNRFGNIPFNGLSYYLPASLVIQPQGEYYDNETKSQKPVYSILSDKSCDSEIILSAMGHCLEVLLTNPEDEFVKYRKDSTGENPQVAPSTYNYASYGDFLMRSQLDCYDERLPGNGTFDLKTRATTNIRYSSKDASKVNNDYQIWKLTGDYESFEKEFKDLIRTGAMLKYLFQARIGQMDGIFIAYHNINSIFGFQYLPLEELDKLYYKGAEEPTIIHTNVDEIDESQLIDNLPTMIGETQFKFSMEIWQTLLKDHILKDLNAEFDNKPTPFRLIVEASKSFKRQVELTVYAVPITTEEIETLQGFSDRFPSDFKLEMPQEQRLKNLARHAEELEQFNEKLINNKNVLSYKVTVQSSTIDDRYYVYSSLPSSKFNDWRIKYNVTKLVKPNNEQLLKLLQMGVNSLSHGLDEKDVKVSTFARSLNKSHSMYEKIGSIRKKSWEAKEKTPVVYHPKYKF